MEGESTNSAAQITRRSLITKLGAVIGAVSAAQLLTPIGVSKALAYSRRANSADSDGLVFKQPQMLSLKRLCAVVIPKTDTPGADEVDCHGFIDQQLHHCHSANEQQQAQALLNTLDQQSVARYQKKFTELTTVQHHALLSDLEQAKTPFNNADAKHFRKLKGLIVFGYFTSELGATKALDYDPIPGEYKLMKRKTAPKGAAILPGYR